MKKTDIYVLTLSSKTSACWTHSCIAKVFKLFWYPTAANTT